jgi:protein-S-isoprenylcysteine O-methyltransferase Ste14
VGLSVLTLVICFIVWAGVHSLLASLPFKDWTRHALGDSVDRWYRLVYVVFAGASGLPLLLMVALLPDRALYTVAPPWRWLMRGGQGLALAAAIWAVLQTGPTYFLGLSQLLDRGSAQADTLQVRGFYCWVRHPLYLLSIIILWLSPAMTVNTLTFYILITLYFAIGSLHEERRLLAEFGDAYRDYQRQVPWLIPIPGRCYSPSKLDQSIGISRSIDPPTVGNPRSN